MSKKFLEEEKASANESAGKSQAFKVALIGWSHKKNAVLKVDRNKSIKYLETFYYILPYYVHDNFRSLD